MPYSAIPKKEQNIEKQCYKTNPFLHKKHQKDHRNSKINSILIFQSSEQWESTILIAFLTICLKNIMMKCKSRNLSTYDTKDKEENTMNIQKKICLRTGNGQLHFLEQQSAL